MKDKKDSMAYPASDLIDNHALVLYGEGDGSLSVEVVVQGETLWATQKALSQIFATERSVITNHLKSIYETGELEEQSTVQKMHIANSAKPVWFYNLDAIISVGYRVNSKKATQFRKWVTGVLGQYIRDGYVIDEIRLREEPEKLNKLAAKIRELRASEKNVYASVRQCFKLAASDYEPSSHEVRRFYALLQDKFHHAVTKMTSSKLILDRAHHADQNMGLQSIQNGFPSLQEAMTGKNYLSENELYRLHLLSEQFLLYAEATALRGENMTMKQLHKQLDNLLMLNGYPVFGGYMDYLKEQAKAHAEYEYNLHMQIRKLELLGVEVDLERFYAGEYEEYREQTAQLSTKDMKRLIDERQAAPLTPKT